jgi:hypothetical protein
MKATDLFKAMQTRTAIYIPTTSNGTPLCLVNGMIVEDGSGINWIVNVFCVNQDTNKVMFIRTTDKGGKFNARVIS